MDVASALAYLIYGVVGVILMAQILVSMQPEEEQISFSQKYKVNYIIIVAAACAAGAWVALEVLPIFDEDSSNANNIKGFSRAKALRYLGLSSDATPSQIKQAYHTKARTMHPNKGGNTEKFQNLQKAYTALQ